MQRTETEILAIGEYTKALLQNETFNALYREHTDAMLNRIVESAPHETKAREFEYAQIRAMTGFITHLAGFAESAAAIIEKQDNPVEAAGLDVED